MTVDDDELVHSYLAQAAKFKQRRLRGLFVLCALLVGVLCLIYAMGWYDLTGTASSGSAWIFVGIGVAACATVAVVIDMKYRKEL
jgi:hypothetical protein